MQEKKRIYDSYLTYFLFFLSLAAFGEQIGFYFSPLNKIWGSFFLLLYLFKTYQGKEIGQDNHQQIRVYTWLGTLFILSLISPLPAINIGFILLISLYLYQYQPERKPEFQTGLVFFIYILFYSFIPEFFLLERAVSDGVNLFLKISTGLSICYSPYAYGFGCLVIIISFAIIQVFNWGKNRMPWLARLVAIAVPILGYFLLFILYFLFSKEYYSLKPPDGYGLEQFLYQFMRLFLPMNGQGIIFIILFLITSLIQCYFCNRIGLIKERETKTSLKSFFSQMIIIAIFLVVLFSFYHNLDIFEPRHQKPAIYIYDTGMDFTTVPSENVYGAHNGMFGMLPKYLQDWGYEVHFGVNWDRIKSENHDILIMTNPNGKLSEEEKSCILSFIRKGGGLFVLGDHTHMFGLKNDYFQLFREMGISFNFDTAMPLRQLWKGCPRSSYLKWDRMVRKDDFPTGISLGASLSIGYPATPLIIGEYGWSDQADLKKPGYLGDQKYHVGEDTGGLVLAAKRNYGRGKLVVFGDTTFVQNLPISSGYPLVKLCLNELLPGKSVFGIIGAICFLLLITGLLFLGKKGLIKPSSGLNMALIIFLLMIWFGNYLGSVQKYFSLPPTTSLPRAGIDNEFYPAHYQADWSRTDKGIGGLKSTIIRSGILPYMIDNSNIKEASHLDYLIILGSKGKISKRQAGKIFRYVSQGGRLILACGYEHRNQSIALLKLLGIDIENIPLSFLSGNDTSIQVRFLSAWPIKNVANREMNILCTALNQYPVVVLLTVGKGKVCIIGDSYFFENRNLESNNMFLKNNIDFAKSIFNTFLK